MQNLLLQEKKVHPQIWKNTDGLLEEQNKFLQPLQQQHKLLPFFFQI